jgi:chaperonin GroEL (HSP60 family)
MNSCCVVEGIVFSKNRTHKKMKSEFENPKILLLDCSVEYPTLIFSY